MENEIDEVVAICSKINIGNTVGIRVPCKGTCGETVWLSDSTINAIKKANPQLDLEKTPPFPMCAECGLPKLMEMKAPEFVSLTAEQLEEIKSELKNL